MVFTFGCAARTTVMKAPDACKPVLKTDLLVQKTDNFLIIFDPSETMSAVHNGQVKLRIAKDIVTSMNQCIPDIPFTGGLRSFGRGYYLFSIFQTDLIQPLKAYARQDIPESLAKIDLAIGNSPMAKALRAAGEDIKGAKGKTAIILVSDGRPTDEGAVQAAACMKKQHGDSLCIYTIQIGDDCDGRNILEQIAKAGGCGFSVNADRIRSCDSMAAFVEKVFFEKKCIDEDNDLVCDDKDTCPGTPKGAKVDERGCWVIGDVLFDFDKAVINTEAYLLLDDVVTVLKNNPEVKVQVQGHTDNFGTAAYNKRLSEKRAAAVKQYLVGKGVNAKRLCTAGYGFSKPAASNATEEGRAKNRRVEFKVK